MSQKAILDNKSLETINLNKVPEADHATNADAVYTIKEIRVPNNTDLETYIDNNLNLHKSNVNEELNLFRFYAENYEQYHLPCVDSHIQVYSIDNTNHWIKLVAYDIRNNNIYTKSKLNKVWYPWTPVISSLNENLIKQDKLYIWLKGNSLIDSSPYNRTITNNGNVTCTTATINGISIPVYNFPNQAGLTLSSSSCDMTNLTVSFWMNTRSASTWSTVFSVGFTSGNGHTFEIRSQYNNSGCLGIAGRTNNSSTSIDVSSGIGIIHNTWFHWVIVKSGINIKWYRNGILMVNQNLASNPTTCTPPNWYLGRCQFNAGAEFLDGLLTDFRLYNYSMDAHEVHRLYVNGPYYMQNQ